MTKSIDLLPTWFWPEGVPRHMSVPRATAYANTVDRWARRRPESVAVAGPAPLSYAGLDEQAKVVSANLRQLGSEHDRIALVTGTDLASVIVLLGTMHSGIDTLLIDEATAPERRTELIRDFRATLVIAAHPIESINVETATLEECLVPSEDRTEMPTGGEGRVALEWDTSFVLHPTAALLGWALAFRAFAMIEPSQSFLTTHRLATWEGVTSLLASLCVGSTHHLVGDLRATTPLGPDRPSAAWIPGDQAMAIADHPQASRWLEGLEWVYLSVDESLPARTRRRISRRLGTPVLTILGTPATGPVAASPREWSIDEAVGIPFTGIDIVPLDDLGRPAEPPWHLITAARVGVQSSLLGDGFEIEGPRRTSELPGPTIDIGSEGRMDANGFLYLL